MSVLATALQRHRRPKPLTAAQVRARSIRRRINGAWGLLFLNTLTFGTGGLLPLPYRAGQAITQGALPLAILVLLTVNPKVKVRPNVFLCLMCLLVLDTVITALQPQHFGTVFRTARLAEYVIALWLSTPWWGRHDLLLLRCHLRWLYIALGSVILGLAVAPGRALSQSGRLAGVVWPIFPTAVAQYAAIAAGLAAVLWLARLLSGRVALAGIALAIPVLVMTHTRTAMVGMVAGVLIAGLSLFGINARVRRFFAVSAVVLSLAVLTLAGVVTAWLARGQDKEGLTSLSGRTDFWKLVLNQPRNTFQEIFGFGMSNASVNGLPIDSNWLASYMMQGLFGVIICALVLLFLFATAFFRSRGAEGALALFLIAYCTLSSFTEVGYADASTYLLDLAVAASLLMSPMRGEAAP